MSELWSSDLLRQNAPQLEDSQFHGLSFLKSKNHAHAHQQSEGHLVPAGRYTSHCDIHT